MAEKVHGRTTVYNPLVTDELLGQINPENMQLKKDFIGYLRSIDRSKTTLEAYDHDLNYFFCWNRLYNNDKFFVDINKREFARFQDFGLNENGWSSSRVRRVKSSLSSLSNYIYNICDDIYESYKPVVRRIESPVNEPVREKTVLSDEEVNYLLDSLVEKGKYQIACAVALAVFSGSRKTELTRFKVSYFDDTNIIFDAMYKTPEKIRTKGRGNKTGKMLYKYTLIDFKKYFDLWMKERESKGIDCEYLLTGKYENDEWSQMKISTLDSYAETCSNILGKPFYFHCLRHQLCSRLCKYNLPPKIVQEYFGWATQDLINIYDDNEAEDDFGNYFTSDGIKQQEQKSLADI